MINLIIHLFIYLTITAHYRMALIISFSVNFDKATLGAKMPPQMISFFD